MKIKLITFITMFVAVQFCGIMFSQNQPQKQKNQTNIYYDADIEMTISPCGNSFDVDFLPNEEMTIKEYAIKNNLKFVITGVQTTERNGKTVACGWYSDKGIVFGNMSRNRTLTHIVQFNTATREFKLIPKKLFKAVKNFNLVEFQTGPLIIDNNKIVNEHIMNSGNYGGQYTRSMLAIKDNSKAYLIVVRTPVSLTEAAEHILNSDLLKKGSVSVLNLDSGKQVSYYSGEHPEYNFNEDNTSTTLITVKK